MAKEVIEVRLRQVEGTATVPLSQLNAMQYDMERQTKLLDAMQHQETVITWEWNYKMKISTNDVHLHDTLEGLVQELREKTDEAKELKHELKEIQKKWWYKFATWW